MDVTLYRNIFVLVVPYSVVVSSLYLFGYWGTFGVNIFEYIGLSDIIKISIYQLAANTAAVSVGLLVGMYLAPNVLFKIVPPKSPMADKIAPFAGDFKFTATMFAIYLMLFDDSEMRWFFAALALTPVISTVCIRYDFAGWIFPKFRYSWILTYVIVTLLVFSFPWGTWDAFKAKKSGATVSLNGEKSSKAYLGRGGSYMFFWEKEEQQVEVVNAARVETMTYQHDPAPGMFSFIIETFFGDDGGADESNDVADTKNVIKEKPQNDFLGLDEQLQSILCPNSPASRLPQHPLLIPSLEPVLR